MAAGGTLLGLLLAGAVVRVVGSHLYGVSPSNLTAFASVGALLLTVALVASYLPARRAVKSDPVRASRHD